MTHQPDFSGCWAKIGRANVHLDFLRERVKSFTKDLDSYEVETKDDWQTAKVFVHGEPVPAVEEWGPIIGDVVHNLRSALDHLVWQLTIANGHTPPPVIPNRRGDPEYKWRQVGFPSLYVRPPLAIPCLWQTYPLASQATGQPLGSPARPSHSHPEVAAV